MTEQPNDQGTTMPTDAQLRLWAKENIKDSRFMHLPADMLRVLIHYVGDMTMTAYMESEEYCQMEQLWKNIGAVHIKCTLCGKFAFNSDVLRYDKTPHPCQCETCDIAVCSRCIKICDVCSDNICLRCTGMSFKCNVCDVIKCNYCVNDNSQYVCEHDI
jgi:hypothetical protein